MIKSKFIAEVSAVAHKTIKSKSGFRMEWTKKNSNEKEKLQNHFFILRMSKTKNINKKTLANFFLFMIALIALARYSGICLHHNWSWISQNTTIMNQDIQSLHAVQNLESTLLEGKKLCS